MRISDWSSDVCSSDLYRPPALFGREELVAVEQHQLVRLGADERHAATAKDFRAINLDVAGDHAVGEAHGIAKLREGGDAKRDAEVSRAACRERVSQDVEISRGVRTRKNKIQIMKVYRRRDYTYN